MKLKDIETLAELCKLELTAEEKLELANEMDAILGFVKQVQEVHTEGAVADLSVSAGDTVNRMRADGNPQQGGEWTDALLAEAPRVEKGYIKVKKIL